MSISFLFRYIHVSCNCLHPYEILTRVLASGYIKLKLEVLDKIGLNAASMPPIVSNEILR